MDTPKQESYDPNERDAMFQKGYAAGVKAAQSDPQNFKDNRIQPAEAGFSTNLYLTHPDFGRVQFTFRGATSNEWQAVLFDLGEFLRHMREKNWHADGEKQPIPAASAPAHDDGEVKYVPVDDGGKELPKVESFTASKLSVTATDGKLSFKVHGGMFEKWGVTVYPEVLAEAKLDVREGQPTPNLAGWHVDWVEYPAKNGKMYKKVTRLLPPK